GPICGSRFWNSHLKAAATSPAAPSSPTAAIGAAFRAISSKSMPSGRAHQAENGGSYICARRHLPFARRRRRFSERRRRPEATALLQPLHDRHIGHAAALAHRLQAVALVALLECIDER